MTKKNKYSEVQMILTMFFIASLLISNIIAVKQIILPFNLVLPAAVIIFPITYILSDVFSEVYGYKWSRKTNYMGICANIFATLMFTIAIYLKAPSFYENSEAFASILGNTPRILFASLLALWLGDYLNDNVFRVMKKKHQASHEGYAKRSIVSSIVGEFGDSLIFIPVAFYGSMHLKVMLVMIITQPTFKICYEILVLPISKKIVLLVSKYENSL